MRLANTIGPITSLLATAVAFGAAQTSEPSGRPISVFLTGGVLIALDPGVLADLGLHAAPRVPASTTDDRPTGILTISETSRISLPDGRAAFDGLQTAVLNLCGGMEVGGAGGTIALVDPVIRNDRGDGWIVVTNDGFVARTVFRVTDLLVDFPAGQERFRLTGNLELSGEAADALGVTPAAGTAVGHVSVSGKAVDPKRDGRTDPRGVNPVESSSAAVAGPDVFVSDLYDVDSYGRVGGISAFAVGTISCNRGDQPVQWVSSTPAHPAIGQSLYRLKSGRMEQVGMSWVKHGFASLNESGCGLTCNNPGTSSLLGVGCSDPYTASLNGSPSFLGPRSEINASNGVFPYPPILNPSVPPVVGRRLQVHDSDLDTAQAGGGQYFVEGQYVAADDAAANNKNNNASYRPVTVTFSPSMNRWVLSLAGATERMQSAIHAWRVNDPSVLETEIDVPDDGRFTLAAKVTDLGGGLWQYEYALHNLSSNRSGRSLSIPVAPTGVVTAIGFHDVDYHSGDPIDGTDWTATVEQGAVTWTTEDYNLQPNANALRWGTMYNFRFQSNVPPNPTTATLGLFKPGTSATVAVSTLGPLLNAADCNDNGVADGLDIADGTSHDCNGNGVPDECETFPELPITTVRVASGLSSPVYVTHSPGDPDRLFIVEQQGRIKILSRGFVFATPFLNIVSRVASGGERGLLSVAFHPDFTANGRFYVNYTNLSGNTVIAQYNVSATDPNVANVNSEVILKTITQDFSNHNGGQLQFGADGYLYVGMGDGGSGNDPNNRAQDGGALLGKMLRLDTDSPPNYIPADNPFVGAGLPLDEIWALGMRNPWRFAFDRLTHDLYIGDVGQNAWEEIDFQPANSVGGENYGWRCMEGLACTGLSGCTCNSPSLTLPIKVYSHAAGACSITGGYVYRGCALPDLAGTYFYADYCSGFIRSFRYVGGAVTEERDRTVQLTPTQGPIGSIVSFGEDADGEVYIVSHLGNIYKIVPDPSGAICGNGLIEPGEQCDDGNTTPGDGCDSNCQLDPNDQCAAARPVSEGAHPFNTVGATTDGPDEPTACNFSGDSQVNSDVWYCYTPSCSGTATVSTCGSGFNTKVAVYEDCACPVSTSAAACDDDACGLQSEVSLPVTACTSYLIRVGGFGAAQGTGTLDVSCTPAPLVTDCNGNGVEDAVDIACGTSADLDTNGIPDECETGGDYIRGGKLYDRWWAVKGLTPPAVDHPLWAYRPDPVSNPSVGDATWRCKECHGWDYKGVSGQYGAGPHRTGFPGVLDTTLSAAQLRTLLTEPPSNGGGPGVLNGHDYGSVLSDIDINDLVSFLLLGTTNADPFIQPGTGAFQGDPVQGETNFTSGGSPSCIVCHGSDGTAINFGTFEDPEYLGTVATQNPWELFHKVRVGQPGAPMPSWLAGGGTNQGVADIGRYIQLNFPTDCVFDEQCDDGVACTDDACNAQGRCISTPNDALCADDGVFCNGAEVCQAVVGCVNSGNPCAVPAACDDVDGDCGCSTPAVAAAGARYLMVTPQAADPSVPIALLVTPVCAGSTTNYVGAPAGAANVAQLVSNPATAARLTPVQWGNTVFVTGIEVVPEQAYQIQADCGAAGTPRPTAPVLVTTAFYGDAAGPFAGGAWTPPDGTIDVLDLTAQVDSFRHSAGAPTVYASDQLGCQPDGRIDIIDLIASIDGFRGIPYIDSSNCTSPCP